MPKQISKRSALLSSFTLLVFCSGLMSAAQATKPIPPFVHAQEAMFKGNLNEAARWYEITARDFSSAKEGRESLIQRSLILASKEISHAKLASLYREASKLQRVEDSQSNVYLGLSQSFEKESAPILEELGEVLLGLEGQKWEEFTLSVSVNPEAVRTPKALSNLEKGEWVGSKERKEIKDAAFLKTYLGLLTTVCKRDSASSPYDFIDSPLQIKDLYYALGSRLLIAGENFGNSKSLGNAKKAFEAVLRETKDKPYDKIRVGSIEFLERIEKIQKKGKKP